MSVTIRKQLKHLIIESRLDYIESNLHSMHSTFQAIVPIGTVYCLQYCYLFSRLLRYKTQQIAATMGKANYRYKYNRLSIIIEFYLNRVD